MNLQEALVLLNAGKSVCRASWQPTEGYLVFLKGVLHIWKILPHPNTNAGNHIFSMAELLAEDWVEFEESRLRPPVDENVADPA